MSEWAIGSKKWVIRSFLVSDLSDLLTVAHFSELLTVAHFWWATWAICSQLLFCHEQPKRFASKKRNEQIACLFFLTYKKILEEKNVFQKIWANRLFFVGKRANVRFVQKNEQFTLLSWATWANRSWLLFCHERPERFAHNCSLTWATWAICSQSLICPERREQIAHSHSFDQSKWVN